MKASIKTKLQGSDKVLLAKEIANLLQTNRSDFGCGGEKSRSREIMHCLDLDELNFVWDVCLM